MSVIQIATPPHFVHGRIEKIGFRNPHLYVALRKDETLLEIWELHSLTPSSWRLVCTIQGLELFYFYFSLSPDDAKDIYALILATFEEVKSDEHPLRIELRLAKICTAEGSVQYYHSADVESQQLVGNLPYEDLQLGSSSDGLYVFDRSMIRGRIPFWRIELNHDTRPSSFTLRQFHVMDSPDDVKCTHFPVILDGGERRLILKITTANELLLYDDKEGAWLRLLSDGDSDLELADLKAVGISETYGREWHRVGAVESPLMILADEGSCLFKIFRLGRHYFYSLELAAREGERSYGYKLRQCSNVKVSRLLQTMFYAHASSEKVVFVNKHLVGFINVQPSKLLELSFWALQKPFIKLAADDQYRGGKSGAELCKIYSSGDNPSLLKLLTQ